MRWPCKRQPMTEAERPRWNLQRAFALQGRAAIVTGGASGIGLACVEALADQGARVTLLDIDGAAAEREAKRLQASGCDVRAAALDVRDRQAHERVFDEAAQAHGGLDIICANAGIDPGPGFMSFTDRSQRLPQHAIENYDDERWQRVIQISLDAVFFAIRTGARLMKPAGQGSIIVTTSISAVRPAPGIGIAYMAAKAGAAQVVRTAALELARYRIRVNAIAPGPFATNIADGRMRDPQVRAAMARTVPLGRVAHPDEIKALVLLLASDAGSFITGEQIVIDGGASLGAVD